MTNRIVPSGRSMHLPLAVGGGEQSLSEHEEYQSGDHDAKTGELPPFGRAHRHLNQAETVYDHTRCELSDDEQEHHIGYAQLWCEKYRCEDKACTKGRHQANATMAVGQYCCQRCANQPQRVPRLQDRERRW